MWRAFPNNFVLVCALALQKPTDHCRAYGTVGLWRGPRDARFPSLIAVKTSNENEPERDLSVEGRIHWRLSATGSAHVVKLLGEPQDNERLIMEYCTNGTLRDLVKKRRRL